SPVMLKPSAFTRFVMKLKTNGAAMDNKLVAVLGCKPVAELRPSVIAVCDRPKSPDRICLPPAINDELGSVAARAMLDIVVSAKVAGMSSSIPRSAWEPSDLLARVPRIVAIDALKPCDTGCPDAPKPAATRSTVCRSSMPNMDDRSELAIVSSFFGACPAL